MLDVNHLAQARITCALEYLARARTALPISTLTDASLALEHAEVALRAALVNLAGNATADIERRRSRLFADSTCPPRAIHTTINEAPPLLRRRSLPSDDDPVTAATSS